MPADAGVLRLGTVLRVTHPALLVKCIKPYLAEPRRSDLAAEQPPCPEEEPPRPAVPQVWLVMLHLMPSPVRMTAVGVSQYQVL